jgi:hypothetical protein
MFTMSDLTTRAERTKPSFGNASSKPRSGTPPQRQILGG